MSAAPRKIEWSGPEGWVVWADEDGVHLRSSTRGDALEMPDVKRLFNLWTDACAAVSPSGQIQAPQPPSREEMRSWSTDRADEYAKRRALRAVAAEFTPPTDAPF